MKSNSRGAVFSLAVWLTFFIAIGWAVSFWPARWLRGSSGVWWMSVAAIAVLIPGWIVVFLSSAAILRNDLVAMLVQTMIRLFTVAAVAVGVRKFWPELGIVDFFGWLIGFYLLALVVEVVLIRRKADSVLSQRR